MRFVDAVTLLAAVLNLSIGFFVVARNGRKRPLIFSFAIFSIFTGLWCLSNFIFYFAPSKFLLESQYSLGAMILPMAIIWFTIFDKSRISKNVLVYLLLVTAVLSIAPFLGNTIVNNFSIISKHDYDLQLSPFFTIYGVIYFAFFAYLIGSVIYSYRKSFGIKKLQIRYIFAGLLSFGSVTMFVSVILPIFNVSVVAPFDAQSSLLFVGFSLYAIVRHRLLDIRFLLTRSVVYGVVLSVVTLLLVFVTFLTGGVFSGTRTGKVFAMISEAFIIVYTIEPLKKWLSRVTDRFFFKGNIDYQEILKKLSEALSYKLDLDVLIRDLRKTLKDELKLKFVATLLRKTVDGSTEEFIALDDMLAINPKLRLPNNGPLIQFLRSHKKIAVLDALLQKIDDADVEEKSSLMDSKDEFIRMGASLVAPIFAQDHLIAVLVLGGKLSGDAFSNEDLNLIEVLTPQIGSAIQKANLYEEVKQFSEGLKVKVDEATSELRERNTSLQTLQHITKEITRTLDFNQVVQQIADSVSTELGYRGAILVFMDDDGHTVRARAVTQTPLTKKALELLPIDFTKYTSDLNDPASVSIGHQVLRSGQTMVTASLAQVISPPIPKLLAQGIQKVLGIKTVVIIPIVSEGRTIGCIEVGVQKPQEDITPQEQETMNALADELGVVSRNIGLFAKIQQTNSQLEVANAHLQQLDQAKSEFVSIASHQLRTPMTGIMGYLSMMTSGDFGSMKPEHKKILEELLGESQRMIRLINQFLNVSKIEAGKFTYAKKMTQLRTLAEQEVKELMHVAKDKGLELKTEFTKQQLPETVADSDKIQDVMLNLIDNAIKYTAKGSITIGVDMKDRDLHFFVRDTGIGIKSSDAKELFNKFVRGAGIAQIHPDGSGLGLFIAKSIIDAHGGHIWVDSEGEGKGSTFQFTLPVVAQTGSDVVVSS